MGIYMWILLILGEFWAFCYLFVWFWLVLGDFLQNFAKFWGAFFAALPLF